GISRDSVASHEKFAAKEALPFPLLADTEERVCKLFDVIKEKSLYGRKYLGVERSTFLLDGAGRLQQEWRKVKVPGHAEEVLAGAQRKCPGSRGGLGRVPRSEGQIAQRTAPVRTRYQRADARSDRHLPLRGARCVPADGRAGGARRPQEGS